MMKIFFCEQNQRELLSLQCTSHAILQETTRKKKQEKKTHTAFKCKKATNLK